MSTFTDEQREALAEKLAEIDKARSPLHEIMKPYRDAMAALDALEASAIAEAGVDVEWLDERCEGCERWLITGDLGHRAADGPVMCEACSPTWADTLAQFECAATDVESAKAERGLTDAEWNEEVAMLRGLILDGKGGEKNVTPL